MSRYRRHKDTAHPAVVEALLQAGALVVVLEQARWATPGRKQSTAGAPDIIATLAGITVALEVKSPGAKKTRLKDPGQLAFAEAAVSHGMVAQQVSTPAQALAAIGAMPRTKAAPAYTPPRTDYGPCATPGCSEKAMPTPEGNHYCVGCYVDRMS